MSGTLRRHVPGQLCLCACRTVVFPPNAHTHPVCRALAYMTAMEYLRGHTADLKSGWFGKIKVNAKWSSSFAPPGPFGGPIQFNTVKGDVVEDQMLVCPHMALPLLLAVSVESSLNTNSGCSANTRPIASH